MDGVKIPWQSLSSDTLTAVIEEFVTRDGTDYGAIETDLATRVAQVKAGLISGKVSLAYDELSDTCTILEQV